MKKIAGTLSPSLAFALLAFAAGCGDDTDTTAMDAGASNDAQVTDQDSSVGTDAGAVDCSDPGEVPPGTGEHAAVLDPELNRIIVYGGNTAAPVMCRPAYDFNSDMWEYRIDCGTWHRINAGGPGVRTRHNLLHDASRNRILLFAGRNRVGFGEYENYNDLWAFDLEANTWSQVATTGDAPTGRSNASAELDLERNRLIVFGGNNSTSGLQPQGLADTYILNLETNAWRAVSSDSTPPRRYYQSATILGDTFYVFGGTATFDGRPYNDVWGFDLVNEVWTEVHPGGFGAPVIRFGAQLFADAASGTLIMAAGHDNTDLGNSNDIWRFNPPDGAWSELVVGDVLNGRALGPCRFPADFTIPDLDAPERRHGFGATQSGTTGYIVWGKGDCGNLNDVWMVDLATGQWELSGPATTSGEACNRSGAASCTELCF